jgi:hypothetical protein
VVDKYVEWGQMYNSRTATLLKGLTYFPYPLDYIQSTLSAKQTSQKEQKLQRLFKNVTMIMITQIRDKRNRPKLTAFIKKYQEAKNSGMADAKKEFHKKFKILYMDEPEEDKDPKFETLHNVFDRIQKTIYAQHRQLDTLVKRVNKLIESKQKKLKRLESQKQEKTDFRPKRRQTNEHDRTSKMHDVSDLI